MNAFYDIGEAATYLGMSRSSLDRLRAQHKGVFEPFSTPFTAGQRYHAEQLKVIERVMLETLTPDQGFELWKEKLILIGKRSS